MERPEPVSLVAPPTVTITRTRPATIHNQSLTALCGSATTCVAAAALDGKVAVLALALMDADIDPDAQAFNHLGFNRGDASRANGHHPVPGIPGVKAGASPP
jgi:hypothetical protein